MIATRPDTQIVKLVITDHLSWDDYELHASLLRDKICAYLAFLESGKLQTLQTPKIPDNPELHIVLAIPQRPPKEVEELFMRIRESLASLGLAFDVELRVPDAGRSS